MTNSQSVYENFSHKFMEVAQDHRLVYPPYTTSPVSARTMHIGNTYRNGLTNTVIAYRLATKGISLFIYVVAIGGGTTALWYGYQFEYGTHIVGFHS